MEVRLRSAGRLLTDGRSWWTLSAYTLRAVEVVAHKPPAQPLRRSRQELFLTVKTIEMHLTRSYRKLDVHGRAELARVLGAGSRGRSRVLPVAPDTARAEHAAHEHNRRNRDPLAHGRSGRIEQRLADVARLRGS
jgi:hypothetical protein